MSVILPAIGTLYLTGDGQPRRVFVVVPLDTVYRIVFDDGTSADIDKGMEPGEVPGAELSQQKALAIGRVAQKRDQIAAGGADTPSGRVDTTDRSITIIQGLVQLAAIGGEAFQETFRRADNTDVEVDASAMIGIGIAVGQFIAAVYRRSWDLKTEIDAAATLEELAAIDVAAGWP